jgi:radical SAM protein with 4Fe4S-binding SPASM domain
VDEINNISNNVTFHITGGEPLESPIVYDVMEYIYSKGKNIYLLTNGTLINETNIGYISKYCSQVKISIDGSSEEINSRTRGKGSLAEVRRGYDLLLREGVSVTVAMTVTKENIDDIQNMVEIFGSRLTLQPFFKAGRGSKNLDLQISGREYYEAMERVEGLQPLGQIGNMLESLRNVGSTKCAMADGEIYIAEDGNVYPCQMLMEEEFIGGNILKNTIEEILESKTFKEVREFSVLKNDECSECPIRLLCGGACRARSYMDTGSIFKNSDFCEYEKLAFVNGIFEVSKLEDIATIN